MRQSRPGILTCPVTRFSLCILIQIQARTDQEEMEMGGDDDPEWVWTTSENVDYTWQASHSNDSVCRHVFALCLESQLLQDSRQFTPQATVGMPLTWVMTVTMFVCRLTFCIWKRRSVLVCWHWCDGRSWTTRIRMRGHVYPPRRRGRLRYPTLPRS